MVIEKAFIQLFLLLQFSIKPSLFKYRYIGASMVSQGCPIIVVIFHWATLIFRDVMLWIDSYHAARHNRPVSHTRSKDYLNNLYHSFDKHSE